jgi:GNAT superfamily N-acetyltransferase
MPEARIPQPMSVILRAGDLDRDAAPLLKLLQVQLSGSMDLSRFDWLYRKCPHGNAQVWLAAEADSGRLVGSAAVFPRKINLPQGESQGFVLGDFCVSAAQRSLGLAIRLQRKCLETVQNGTFSAGFDLPSRTMLAVYRRLGLVPRMELIRMVKLLRADRKIASKIKNKTVSRVLGGAANTLLALNPRSSRMKSGVTIATQEGRCSEEYTALSREVGGRLGICVDRSADYLNWRYFEHPYNKYEFLAARYRGQLKGYLVFLEDDAKATIVDWFGHENRDLRMDLIRCLVVLLKQRGCESVQASILASHPCCEELKALGFRFRDSSPLISLRQTGRKPGSEDGNENWLLMDGDRES